DLLAMLGRRPEAARVLVLGTYRPADLLASSHPLGAVTQELHAHGRCVEVPLALLTPDEVEQFVRLQLGERDVAPGLVDVIYARTEGNPLFMVNVVDDLRAREQCADPDGGLPIEVPESLRGMIEKQLRRLDAEERRMLEAASVAGVEFRPGAVAAALEQDAQ